jgi:hypothetical protein
VIAECPAAPAGMDSGPARAVTVDPAAVIGKLRSLQGAHWDPGPASGALSKNYVAMGGDMIRTHDAGGINGSGAGDIDGPGRSRLFPSWSADPAARRDALQPRLSERLPVRHSLLRDLERARLRPVLDRNRRTVSRAV